MISVAPSTNGPFTANQFLTAVHFRQEYSSSIQAYSNPRTDTTESQHQIFPSISPSASVHPPPPITATNTTKPPPPPRPPSMSPKPQPSPRPASTSQKKKKKLQKQPSATALLHRNNTPPSSPSTTSLTPLTQNNRASTPSLGTPLSRAPSIPLPAPPPKLHRLSELLDPAEQQQLRDPRTPSCGERGEGRGTRRQSPSGGNRLHVEASFAKRPLTVGERQQRIREETVRKGEEASRERLRVARREGGRERELREGEQGWVCCGVM